MMRIKISIGVSKRKARNRAKKAHSLGHFEGYKKGEASVINNIRKRVELLNPDYPVPVAELRKWVGLDD